MFIFIGGSQGHKGTSMEKQVRDPLKALPGAARRLFAVIARQASHGPIHGKAEGVATPPEILEACGLDPEEFYALLKQLETAGLVLVSNSYPFEEIRLTPEAVDGGLY